MVTLAPGAAAAVASPYQTSASPSEPHPVATARVQVMASPETPVTWESTAVPVVVAQPWAKVITSASPAVTPFRRLTLKLVLVPAGREVLWRTYGLVTVMVNGWVPLPPLASVAVMDSVLVVTTGANVPYSTPVLLSSCNPKGNTPVDVDQVRAP